MSSEAEALLQSLAEEGSTLGTDTYSMPSPGRITIDTNRVLHVPDELKRIAVQFDHRVEETTFDCPRYWDNTDLSTLRIYFNYVREDGVPGSAVAENVVVDDEDENLLHFDWVVDRHVTLIPGKLQFNVCASSVDASGYEEVHWNTEICNDCYVSEGLNCNDQVPETYPDVVNHLLDRMDEIEEDAEKINSYTQDIATANSNAASAKSTANTALGKVNNAVAAAEQAEAAASAVYTLADEANEAAQEANTIAKGRNRAHVFATTADMQTWLRNSANKDVAMVGDNLYIVDLNVPDWWISEVLTTADGTTGYFYNIAQLETQKVDLSTYYTNTQTDNLLAGKLNSNASAVGVTNGVIAADSGLTWDDLMEAGVTKVHRVESGLANDPSGLQSGYWWTAITTGYYGTVGTQVAISQYYSNPRVYVRKRRTDGTWSDWCRMAMCEYDSDTNTLNFLM